MMKGSTLQDAERPGFENQPKSVLNFKHLNVPTEVTGLSQKCLP